MITKDNYQEYMIDYLEGSLKQPLVVEMERFLNANPDIKEEVELFDSTPIPGENIIFKDKELLKKQTRTRPVSGENIDEWSIARIEGGLEKADKCYFDQEVKKHSALEKIFKQYQSTVLPREQIPFPGTKPYKLPDFNDKPREEDVKYWIIAALENDLNEYQSSEWEAFKQKHPSIEGLEESFKETFLPRESITFPWKQKLKKRRIRYLYPTAASVAAAAAFILFFVSLSDIPETTYEKFNQQVAQTIQQKSENKTEGSNSEEGITAKMQKQIQEMYTQYREEQEKQIVSEPQEKSTTREARETEKIGAIAFRKEKLTSNQTNQQLATNRKHDQISSHELLKKAYADKTTDEQFNNKESELTLFKVAQKGVQFVNKKTGTDISLEKTYANNGKKKKIRLTTRRFSISKTTNK